MMTHVTIFYIHDNAYDAVTVRGYRQNKLKGSCGYEISKFYFMYEDIMKDECIYVIYGIDSRICFPIMKKH